MSTVIKNTLNTCIHAFTRVQHVHHFATTCVTTVNNTAVTGSPACVRSPLATPTRTLRPKTRLTRTLGQAEGFALLEGRHLVEGLAVLGVLEAAEVDALAVQHQVRQLFGQFDFGLGGL